ncbi:MAG: hypothetical protein HQM11_11025 [SAR324 cluster bacterium]|nr:hypothetical protein [SAR324 cluster bacterium]
MKSQIIMVFVGFIALAGIVWGDENTPDLAQKKIARAPTERMLKIQALEKGPVVAVEHENYWMMPELRATPDNPPNLFLKPTTQSRTEQAEFRKFLEKSTFVEQKGNFKVFSQITKASPMRVERISARTNYPVLLNQRTGVFAIVTGNVLVKLKEMTQVEPLAQEHQLKLIRRFDAIQTASYEFIDQDILHALSVLRQDVRVEEASLELIEHLQIPN